MNEPYFYANLAHHLAVARRSHPGWAKLRAAAPERLREVLPVEAPASRGELGERLSEARPELDDLEAWIKAALEEEPCEAEEALNSALNEVRSAQSRRSWSPKLEAPGLMLDTRPFKPSELLGFQRALVDGARAWASGISDYVRAFGPKTGEPSSPPSPPEAPMPDLDEQRVQRILVLDGERGTGKTAILLSLVRQWKEEQPRTVLPVDLLDFDPRPSGVGTYPWLLTAFRRLARWLDEQQASVLPRPESGRWSLHSTWAEVYRKALLGWNRAGASGSREEQVADAREADAGWSELRAAWRQFVDKLIAAATKTGILAEHGLLMLGIDDLDLNERQVRELLGALRLLSHPRLIVLITGHIARLERVLALELFREAAVGLPNEVHVDLHRGEVDETEAEEPLDDLALLFGDDGAEDSKPRRRTLRSTALVEDVLGLPQLKEDARHTAKALVNKGVPARLRVPKLTVREAIHLAAALNLGQPPTSTGAVDLRTWLVEVRETSPISKAQARLDWRAGAAMEWLDATPSVRPEPCLTVRAVAMAAGRERPPQQVFQALLKTATDWRGDPLLDPWMDPKVELALVARIIGQAKNPIVAKALSVEVLGRPDLRVPELADFALRIASPAWEPTWRAVEESPVVTTRVEVLGQQVRLGWPMPKARLTLLKAEELLLAIGRFSQPRLETPDAMLRFWIWYCMTIERGGHVLATPATLPGLPDLLSELNTLIDSGGELQTWALRALPLLTAPEHGLGEASIEALYDFTRERFADSKEWSRLAEDWGGLREAQYSKALGSRVPGELADELRRMDAGKLWAARLTRGGRAQWYSVPTPGGRDVLVVLGGMYNQLGNSNGSDLFSIAENRSGRERRHPLWSATAVTDFLSKLKPFEAEEFRGVVDLASREASDRALLPYLVSAWKLLCKLTGLTDEADRVRLTEDQDSLEFAGPRVELCPEEVETGEGYGYELRTMVGWSARQEGAKLEHWPPALVGWLGQIQTALWRTSHPADFELRANLVVTRPRLLATKEVNPGLPAHYDWLDIERLRLMWDIVLTQVPKGPVGLKARKRFLLANWLHAVTSVRGDNLLRDAPLYGIPVAASVLSGTMNGAFNNNPARIPMRAWLLGLDIRALADPEVVTDWNRQRGQLITRAKIAPDEAIKTLRSWAQGNPMELERVIQDRGASRQLIELMTEHPGRAPNDARALETIVGPDAMARIRTWMELGG
jgi:hypothetical protein